MSIKRVLTAPSSPPQNVTGVVLSSTDIQMNWTDVAEIDQNGVITEYEVMYEPLMTFMGTESLGTNLTTILSIVLQGLQEYVEYNISVRAYTNDGAGPYSVGIIRRTLQDGKLILYNIFLFISLYAYAVPSSSPNNVQTMTLSSSEIRVMWEEVDLIDQNGIITRYEVTYNREFDVGNQSNFTDRNTLNTTITGLDEFTEYNISVRAYTIVGPGPYSRAEREETDEDGNFNKVSGVASVVLWVLEDPLLT